MVGAMPPEACVDFRHPASIGMTIIAKRIGARLFIQNQPQARSAIEQDETELSLISFVELEESGDPRIKRSRTKFCRLLVTQRGVKAFLGK